MKHPHRKLLVLVSLYAAVQTAMPQALQVKINSNRDPYFCIGSNTSYYLDAVATGGTAPYSFEWTGVGIVDTIRGQSIRINLNETGVVRLLTRDNSNPPKTREISYKLTAIEIDADFLFSPNNECAQERVQFISIRNGGIKDFKYFWNFDDGSSSNLKDPVKEFVSSGCSGFKTFNVKLEIEDKYGCRASVSKPVTVKNKPHLVFEDNTNKWSPFKHCHALGEDPEFSIELVNKSTHTTCIQSYKVDWGDGTIVDDATFPLTHTYKNAGAFELIITAENSSGCPLTWRKYVYNQSTPNAGLTSFEGSQGCAPIEFKFLLNGYENNSIGTSYIWDFGDGSDTIVWDYYHPFGNDTMKHTYTIPSCDGAKSQFSTVVTVNNGCGRKKIEVDGLFVWIKPRADIYEDQFSLDTICINKPVQLQNNSDKGYYGPDCLSGSDNLWDFGNGSTSVLEQPPPVSWSVPGTYDITLETGNPCGTSIDTFQIRVVSPVKAIATVDATEGCAPLEPKISNTSTGEAIKFLWRSYPSGGVRFINGTDEHSKIPSIRFSNAGNYRLVLYATNACGTDSTDFNFKVFNRPAVLVDSLPDVCLSSPIIEPTASYYERGKPITSYRWSFPGGSPSTSAMKEPGSITYGSEGEHVVRVEIENECGTNAATDTFVVHKNPVIKLPANTTVCENTDFKITGVQIEHVDTFYWYTSGDGRFSDKKVLNPTYFPGSEDISRGNVTLGIQARGIAACGSGDKNFELTIVQQPSAFAGNNTVVCEGKPYTVTDARADHYKNYRWRANGDGLLMDENTLRPTYHAGNSDLTRGYAILSLIAYPFEPCLDSVVSDVRITYSERPSINAGADADICENGSVTLNGGGTGYSSVQWTSTGNAGTFSNNRVLSPTFQLNSNFADEEVFLVIEANGGTGCDPVYDTVMLSVVPLPVVNAGNNERVCEDGTVQLSGASVDESPGFSWTVAGDGSLSDPAVLDPVFTPGANDIKNGTVRLELTARGNSVCPSVSGDIIIEIQQNPRADAGPDAEICKSDRFLTQGSHTHASTINWTTMGTGIFEQYTALNTHYIPSPADINNGSVELILNVDAMNPCITGDTDTMLLTFIDPPEVFAGNDTTICSPTFRPAGAWVLNSTQYIWSSDGTGNWRNETTLTPEYTPSQADVNKGFVNLRLSSTNQACPEVEDAMRLNLTPYPVANAGPDAAICEDKTFRFSYSSVRNHSGLLWHTTGDGHFDDNTSVTPEYIPGTNDILKGKVKLFLEAFEIAPCTEPSTDTMMLGIQKNPIAYAGPDQILGEGESLTINFATAENASQVTWKTLGDGRFTSTSSLQTTYNPGVGDLNNRGVSLVLTARAINPCLSGSTDTLFLLITPKPKANAGDDITICEGSDVNIVSAKAEEYSEIFWETRGTGQLTNQNTLSPSYSPSPSDIEERKVVLVLNARGKAPIEHYIHQDSMVIAIMHDAFVDALPLDTVCENRTYTINDVQYSDVSNIEWSSSGSGNFNGPGLNNPAYQLSGEDREKDQIQFFVRVNSIAPCVHEHFDTVHMRVYHEPEPMFTYDPEEGCAPLTVSFENNSTGEETSYSWDFGNGLSSILNEPGDIRFDQGVIADTTYYVVLTGSNRCNTITKTSEVLVKPIPISDFGMDVYWGCSPKEINFFNVTTGLADTYTWKWGDGEVNGSDEQPLSHVFKTDTRDTTYTITLIAENECGVDSVQKQVKIFPNKVKAFFETDTTFGCEPFGVSFKNYSRGILGNKPLLNWSWNFGDGNVSNEQNPVHVFTEPGTYDVVLHVNDTCSYDSDTVEIVVFKSPDVNFLIEDAEICTNDTARFTPVNMPAARFGSLIWEFGDSAVSSKYAPNHLYAREGEYPVQLTAVDIKNGCASSITKSITVHDIPLAFYSFTDSILCRDARVDFINQSENARFYRWDFGNGNVSATKNGMQHFYKEGEYTITLEAINQWGCSNTYYRGLTIYPRPEASFEPSSRYTCFPPVEVEYLNTTVGGDDYRWDFGNGVSSRNTNDKTAYTDYGSYDVSLIATNKYTCSDTAVLTYHVYHNPVAAFDADTTTVCDPTGLLFHNQSQYGLEYYWNVDGSTISKEFEPEIVFDHPGISTVGLLVIGEGGCRDSIRKENYITTNPSPEAYFDYERINEEDTVQFYNHSTGATGYLWDFGDNTRSDEIDPLHGYPTYDTFYVSLRAINEYQCINTYTDSINLEFFKGLYIPNAFSPQNLAEEVHAFRAVGMGLIKFHLLVFDTWGNLIWETTALENGIPVEEWNGTTREGKELSPDVYVWHLKDAVFKDGSVYKGPRYGTITLLK